MTKGKWGKWLGLLAIVVVAIAFYSIQEQNRLAASKQAQVQRVADVVIQPKREKLEYGEPYLISDLIAKQGLSNEVTIQYTLNGQPVRFEEQVAFDKLGIQTLSINYSCGEASDHKQFSFEVVDTVAPLIYGVKSYEIYEGETLEYTQDVYAEDAVDGLVAVEFVGEADLNKSGVYVIEVVAQDKSNNQSTVQFEITVKEKEIAVTPQVPSTNTPAAQPTITRSYFTEQSGRQPENVAALNRALEIIQEQGWSRSADQFELAKTLNDYVYQNTGETYSGRYWTAYAGLVDRAGSCWAFAHALHFLAQEMGLPTQIVAVRFGTQEAGFFSVFNYETKENIGMMARASDHMSVKMVYQGKTFILEPQGGVIVLEEDGKSYIVHDVTGYLLR